MRHFYIALCCLLVSPLAWSQSEGDYEFLQPQHLAETGEDDASYRLAEGFEGLEDEPRIDTTIEPIDGAGGFDNVAPKLGTEEGPGGLDWDPSPTYRTRYGNGSNYVAGADKRIQGNNWFTTIPYVVVYSTSRWVRFDANTYRTYNASGGDWYGTLGNAKSKMTETGSQPNRTWKVYDTRGKTYTFTEASPASGRCTKIEGLGGAEITFTYSTNITILQKPSSAGAEVRRFTYYLQGSSTRLDRIEIEEKVGGAWTTYRKIDFSYSEDVSSPAESTTGDLVQIKEETLLSSGSWLERKWVFKYYLTGAGWHTTTNPGYSYQVKAVLGPKAVHDYEVANPMTGIHTQTAAQLSSYVDRTYEYASDRRCRKIDFKDGCGCGGGEGIYEYAWDTASWPSDNNTWYHRATITLPSDNGSSRIIDYNRYGQRMNYIAQEDAGDTGSRRWIQTWTHDTTGRLTESFSVKACTSYNDSTHAVTTNSSYGERFTYAYDGNNALATVKLRDPANGNQNYQRKKAFTLTTSGSRMRFTKDSDTVYQAETTTDSGGDATSYAYTFHSSDALAVKKRTTTMPVVTTGQNGSNSAITVLDYFETDGFNTWHKDGDGYVHYTGYDSQRRTTTKTVRNVETDNLPSGVPSAPAGGDFDYTATALNIVTDFEYDYMRRPTKEESPSFNAWNGSSIASTRTTRRW